MECERKDISPVVTEFSCVVPKEEVAKEIEKGTSEWSLRAKLDGFRKGKAPRHLVLKHFGEKIEAEALERLVQKRSSEILKNEKEPLYSRPQYRIDSYSPGNDFAFTLIVERIPSFELKPLDVLKIEKIECEPSREEMDEAYKKFTEDYKKPISADKAVEDGDFVDISLHTSCMGRSVKELSSEQVRVRAGVGRNDIFWDTLTREVVGKSKDEIFNVKIQLPRNFPLRSCEGRQVIVKVQILDVLPLSNTTFTEDEAKTLGADSVDKFREQFDELFKSRRNEVLQLCRKRAVLDALADVYDFDVPLSVTDTEFGKIWRIVQPELQQAREQDDEDIRGKTDEEIQKEYQDLAIRRVRLGFVLNKIAQEHKVQLTEEHVRNAVAREMMKNPSQADAMARYFQAHPEAVERLVAPVLEELVVARILELADVTHKSVTPAELDELVKEILPDAE